MKRNSRRTPPKPSTVKKNFIKKLKKYDEIVSNSKDTAEAIGSIDISTREHYMYKIVPEMLDDAINGLEKYLQGLYRRGFVTDEVVQFYGPKNMAEAILGEDVDEFEKIINQINPSWV